MGLSRRQFLVMAGSASGLGLAFLSQRLFAQGNAPPTPAPVTPVSPPTPMTESVGPAGLFAPQRGDVRIVVISDLNSQYGSTDYEPEVDKAIALIPDWKPDLVLCGGDMVAGQYPSLTKPEIQAMWAGFDRHIGAPLRQAQLPYGFTVGNHDASGALAIGGQPLFAQERDLATAHWNDPRHDPGIPFVDRAGFPFYYTFEQKQVFYLVWDASTSIIPQAQLDWAAQSLASPAAQKAKMRIVIGHLPLYAVAVGRDELGEILARAEELRSLLERYRVHTYISGHDHAYYPAHQGKLQLLHCGILGSGPRPLLNSHLPTEKTLTVIDIDLNAESTTYTTYDAVNLQVVDFKKLPRLIVGPNGRVLRRDIEITDLTPAEQALTWVSSTS
ncbi:metallophosphoesterase [Neosynechococcus sphagnicola sy1]|uniref:Metallophosphoesterase n=1 Tax=Neosynechococcus sphagnicola sy1 TaxID=1497020 RepID=A0A098THK4_9CYAN|nr:metallophosphoesterase [Neosynechococcus sphagnicola]KGF71457.1 metallophosphoesterase [Neosynechococcus sphagnicola sy1]